MICALTAEKIVGAVIVDQFAERALIRVDLVGFEHLRVECRNRILFRRNNRQTILVKCRRYPNGLSTAASFEDDPLERLSL